LRIATIHEAFMTKVQFSFIAAIVLSFPMHLYHIVSFVLPALTRKERTIMGSLLSAGGVLFVSGVAMAYFVVLPLALQFLLSKELMPIGVDPIIDYQKNIMFAAKMVLAFAVLFQLPLVLVVLMAFDIVKRATLLKFSRYFIVLIFVVSAIMTPPDIVSQVALSLPLIVLYFLSIFVAKMFGFGNPD
jgi:sec-independent protein translocase protein TatC